MGRCDDDVAASGHSEQSDETEDSEPEDAASHDNAKSFACHIMEEVVRGRVTVKGVTDMLNARISPPLMQPSVTFVLSVTTCSMGKTPPAHVATSPLGGTKGR